MIAATLGCGKVVDNARESVCSRYCFAWEPCLYSATEGVFLGSISVTGAPSTEVPSVFAIPLVLQSIPFVLQSRLYCNPTRIAIPLALQSHSYCNPTRNAIPLVLQFHLYCNPVCIAILLALQSRLHCKPACVASPLVLQSHSCCNNIFVIRLADHWD